MDTVSSQWLTTAEGGRIGASIACGANDASEAGYMPDGIDHMPGGIDHMPNGIEL